MKAIEFHLTTTGERRVQIAVRNRLRPKICSGNVIKIDI